MKVICSLLGCLLLFAAGCRSVPAAPAQSWHLALATTPLDPIAMNDTQFQLRVTDAAGHPVAGAAAAINLVMATMDMGPNPVALSPGAPGLYTGTGHFTMAGDWNCQVTVSLGDRSQIQVFHYKVS